MAVCRRNRRRCAIATGDTSGDSRTSWRDGFYLWWVFVRPGDADPATVLGSLG